MFTSRWDSSAYQSTRSLRFLVMLTFYVLHIYRRSLTSCAMNRMICASIDLIIDKRLFHNWRFFTRNSVASEPLCISLLWLCGTYMKLFLNQVCHLLSSMPVLLLHLFNERCFYSFISITFTSVWHVLCRHLLYMIVCCFSELIIRPTLRYTVDDAWDFTSCFRSKHFNYLVSCFYWMILRRACVDCSIELIHDKIEIVSASVLRFVMIFW